MMTQKHVLLIILVKMWMQGEFKIKQADFVQYFQLQYNMEIPAKIAEEGAPMGDPN